MEEQVLKEKMAGFHLSFTEMENQIKEHIIGQDTILKHILYAIIAGGHVLLEGPPGLGKTELVKQLSRVFDLSFSRIQFTPDLMPSDIIGSTMIDDPNHLTLSFQKGPIFNSLILADEINRGTPKTQSALLEGMQEYTVSVDQKTHALPEPFFVMATKNPLDMEGTFPLPEAQLDRFMFNLVIKLPAQEDLLTIMRHTTVDKKHTRPKDQGVTASSLQEMKALAEQVLVSDQVMNKAIRLMMDTHPDQSSSELVKKYVKCGVSPRGVQSIIKAGRVKALSEGRYHVSEADIQALASPCFRHRIFTNYQAYGDQVTPESIIEDLTKG